MPKLAELQLNAKAYRCEMIRESCQTDDEQQCYMNANAKFTEIGNGYYVGPYCGKDSYSIFLGVFLGRF